MPVTTTIIDVTLQYETDQIIEFLDIVSLLVMNSCWNLSLFNVYINRVITLDYIVQH